MPILRKLPKQLFAIALFGALHTTIAASDRAPVRPHLPPPAESNLSIGVTSTSPDPVNAGDTVTVGITTACAGLPVAGVQVLLTFPAGINMESYAVPPPPAQQWACTDLPGLGAACSSNSGEFAGGPHTFSLTLRVAPSTTAGLKEIPMLIQGGPSSIPASESIFFTVTTSADREVTMTDSPDPVNAGGDLLYTITAINHGPSNAATAALTDTIPAGTVFRSIAAPAGWSCTTPAVNGTGDVICTISSFPPGTVSFPLTVRPPASTPGGTLVTNTANLGSTTTDPNTGNNSASSTTTVNLRGLSYYTLPPCRLYDSRILPAPLHSSVPRTIVVTGTCGIPATAQAILATAVAVNPPAAGELLLFRGDGQAPPTPTLSFRASRTRATNAIVQLAHNGDGTVTVLGTWGPGTLDLVIDILGYLE